MAPSGLLGFSLLRRVSWITVSCKVLRHNPAEAQLETIKLIFEVVR